MADLQCIAQAGATGPAMRDRGGPGSGSTWYPDEPGELPFQVVVRDYTCLNWEGYDPPRCRDVLAPTDGEASRAQAQGFRNLGELLHKHYQTLKNHRNALAQAWQGPAAEVMLQHIDRFTAQLLSDARCASTTSTALFKILNTYGDAKAKMATLNNDWNKTTSIWNIEWWDDTAEELKTKAAVVMAGTHEAISDHRTDIIVPKPVQALRDAKQPPPPPPPPDLTKRPAAPAMKAVPPIPGYPIYTTAPGSGAGDPVGGPDLASGPQVVPALPGSPVSMLPIPPGNPYAPNGGAYILPGPGVGKAGYIVPMPQPQGRTGSGAIAPGGSYGGAGRTGAAGIAGSAGMMPVPMGGGAPPGGSGRGGGNRNGKADTRWQVAQGVPPVIEGVSEHAFIQDRPSATQEAEFQDWFAKLAYPWRDGDSNQGGEPQVILRKAKP